MCGFAGLLSLGNIESNTLVHTARSMANTLIHRGPDDSGFWSDPASGVAVAFRRLSILDLSPAGHQPMCSPDDRYIIVFNGEIYNFAELRAKPGAKQARHRRGAAIPIPKCFSR